MPRSPEETYIQTYQKYLKQKGTSEAPSTYTASTKLPKSDPSQCKICTVLAKPPDLYRVLNQGLYHKYTASQDYFYTRDINSLLNRKRKPFCVRYNDDLIYDECKERLKGFFRKKDSQSLMTEIKDFYTKFKNFPRNFHPHYSAIINSNIRKHRRLEYIKVFNNPNFDESRGPGDLEAPDDGQFNFMELLGSSFLQDNYKDISGVAVGGPIRDGESTMREITANFRALYSVPANSVNEPGIEPFSNAMYNKNYMLYSRSDSTTAEDILKQIVNEFHEGNLEKKPAMTLAEKVLQQVAANNKNHPRKQENRYSSALKQRGQTGLESSSILHNSKKSLGSSTSIMTSSQLQVQKQNSQPLNTTSQRGNSNPRSNSHAETESTMLGKLSHNPSGKFSVENLNEIVINRNKILSKLYQFRSTRSKSGGLKSSGSTTTTSCKTPSAMRRRPLGIDTQGFDSVDSKQVQTMVYTQEKSHSQSPERRLSREKSAGAIEVNIPKQKMNAEAPYYSAGLPRSTSNGRNVGMMDARDLTSPLQPARTRSSPQKKTSGTSSVARRTPVVQNYIFDGVDNSGDSGLHNINNVSHNQENPNTNQQPTSPSNGKFINPLRNSLGGTQQNYYFRHQSPIDDRVTQVSSVLQKVRSEARMKNLNIRAMKNNSPNRVGTSPSRVGAMSFSRRQQTQTMLDVSQGANSFAAGQTANNGSHMAKNRSLRKSEAQVGGNKTSKRSSIIQNPVINPPEERVEKEKKTKKGALEISNGNVGGYKDLRLPSKEQTPSNFFPNSATSYQKIKNEMRRSGIGSFTTKASGKDVKFGVRK